MGILGPTPGDMRDEREQGERRRITEAEQREASASQRTGWLEYQLAASVLKEEVRAAADEISKLFPKGKRGAEKRAAAKRIFDRLLSERNKSHGKQHV